MVYFLFSLSLLLSCLIAFLIRILLRKKAIPLPLRILLPLLEILSSIALAFWLMVYLYAPKAILFLLMGAYAVLLMDGLAGLISLLIEALRRKKARFCLLPILSLALSLSYGSFGMIRSAIVTPQYLECSSSKLHHSYTFAFLADLHIGTAQPYSITEKTIKEIREKKLDFLVIGGDLVDCFTTVKEMKDAFSLFSSYSFPVYLIYGNHEVDDLGASITDADLRLEASKNNVIILEDDFVPFGEDLLLLGRKDLASKDRASYDSMANPSPSSFLLAFDHQPSDFKSASSFGVDFQLSGHTHDGQLFPLGWLYNLATYPYGDYWHDSKRLFVSSGASSWGAPFRTQGSCHYQIVTLIPKA